MTGSQRVKFFLTTDALPTDSKTTVLNLRSIQICAENELIYEFPESKWQVSVHHKELATIPVFKAAMKSMNSRGLRRHITVTLSESLREMYIDDDGNAIFNGELLMEGTAPPPKVAKKITEDDTKEPSDEKKRRSLQSITKDMVLEKFVGRNQNARTWIAMFEDECTRMEVSVDQRCDALRLFLEGPPTDWYAANRKLIGVGTWLEWKQSFLDTFDEKGWSELALAYNYRFMNKGTIAEYVLKKLNLLVEADPDMCEKSRVNMIVVGLPPWIRDRIARSKVTSQGALIREINQLESLASRQPRKYQGSNLTSNTGFSTNSTNSSFLNTNISQSTRYKGNRPNRKPCSICEKRGKPGMMHPESACHFRDRDTTSIKVANNIELEKAMNEEIEAKN